MENRFFVKAGRHSKEEKTLYAEISALIEEAESSGNSDLIGMVKKHPPVNNAYGLRSMLEEIKKHTGSARRNIVEATIINENTNIKDDNMSNKKDNQESGSPSESHTEEPSIPFEEVIDTEKQSQFQQPVKEREDEFAKYKKDDTSQGGGGSNGNGGGNDSPSNDDNQSEHPIDDGNGHAGGDDDTSENPTGNLNDIPDDAKRKAIKSTAELVSKIYAGALPILPKYVAKVSDTKIERMAWSDELDPNMKLQLPEGGYTTVIEYVQGYNASLDEQLTITPDMQEDFRKALKAVLEEKQVALTPMQQLTGVVVSHLFYMGGIAMQNSIMMKRNLDFWKEAYAERKQGKTPDNKNTPPPSSSSGSASPPPPPPPPPPTPATPNPSPNGRGGGAHSEEIQEETDEITIKPEQVQEQ